MNNTTTISSISSFEKLMIESHQSLKIVYYDKSSSWLSNDEIDWFIDELIADIDKASKSCSVEIYR